MGEFVPTQNNFRSARMCSILQVGLVPIGPFAFYNPLLNPFHVTSMILPCSHGYKSPVHVKGATCNFFRHLNTRKIVLQDKLCILHQDENSDCTNKISNNSSDFF